MRGAVEEPLRNFGNSFAVPRLSSSSAVGVLVRLGQSRLNFAEDFVGYNPQFFEMNCLERLFTEILADVILLRQPLACLLSAADCLIEDTVLVFATVSRINRTDL